MEAWSDSPIENFKLKFFLDTNILVFLIDGTYVGLSNTILKFNELGFVDLVSSNFVIFEFLGVRKKEHYLRMALADLTTPEGTINVSTLLKYRDGFDVPSVNFAGIREAIQKKVGEELEKITNDFNIIYSSNLLHDDLLSPTFDICLSSKISKEDSLVLTSSLLPEPSKPEKQINLLSKDEQFIKAFQEFDINSILDEHSLCKPDVLSISKISLISGDFVNLTAAQDIARLEEFLPKKLLEMIVTKNDDLYLGETFTPENHGWPADVICFKIKVNKELPANSFITIIGNDLSFIYTSKHIMNDFRQNGTVIQLPFVTNDDGSTNISFKMLDDEGKNLAQDIIDFLKRSGNKIFIHPDSL